MSARLQMPRRIVAMTAFVALAGLAAACTSPGATTPPSPTDVMMEHSPSASPEMMDHSPAASGEMMEEPSGSAAP